MSDETNGLAACNVCGAPDSEPCTLTSMVLPYLNPESTHYGRKPIQAPEPWLLLVCETGNTNLMPSATYRQEQDKWDAAGWVIVSEWESREAIPRAQLAELKNAVMVKQGWVSVSAVGDTAGYVVLVQNRHNPAIWDDTRMGSVDSISAAERIVSSLERIQAVGDIQDTYAVAKLTLVMVSSPSNREEPNANP